MAAAYRFIKLYDLKARYFPKLLLAAFVWCVSAYIRHWDSPPYVAAVLVGFAISFGIEWMFGLIGFYVSGLMNHRRTLGPEDEKWLASLLSETEYPQQWARNKPRLVLLELGAVPFFAATNVREPLLYISTHTLRNTDPEDWPMLMLVAGGYLQAGRAGGCFDPQLPAWAVVAYALVSHPLAGLVPLGLMLFISPLIENEHRGKYLRYLFNWLTEPEKQQHFVHALLNYYGGFEPGSQSTRVRRYLLRTMGFRREKAMAYLAEA